VGDAYSEHTILKKVYDAVNEALRVNQVAGGSGSGGGGDVTIVDVDTGGAQTNDLEVKIDAVQAGVKFVIDDTTPVHVQDVHAKLGDGHGQVYLSTVEPAVISSNATRKSGIIIINMGPDTAYVGFSGVTSSEGFPLYPRGVITIPSVSPIYGALADTADEATVAYLEV
jgi:hypothetical protein